MKRGFDETHTLALSLSNWRGIFFLLGFLALACVALSLLLTETHKPEQTLGDTHISPVQSLLHELNNTLFNAKILAKDPSFRGLSLFMSIAGAPYFAFIAVISYIVLDFFGQGYLTYNLIYASICAVSLIAPCRPAPQLPQHNQK